MNHRRVTIRSFYGVFLLVLLGMCLAGCASSDPPATLLRVTNGGPTAVESLTVLFPEDEIYFGDIAAGTTTEYQMVPNGIYNYAAYRFKVDGQTILQPVIDWVGEQPLPGKAFTYTIDFHSNRPQGSMVQLINITVDE